ncbi:hypothetical protein QAD02_005657 [Eretmocerus hayati]|uniref:Uncharacterized protein n=1 Tax=Eretmocerus hayati TaxID=131215 RepID=A0ACC2NT09_9HYME|nr:hypothetical protein QAD02_005657 [Eretmocerus hayati]
MHDIKDVITTLCNHLSNTINSTLTPEHFRLAKYDKKSPEIINAFWTALDKLTYLVMSEMHEEFISSSFDVFSKHMKTKLRLAFLRYPSIEIYKLGATSEDCSSRELLIAFTWLITEYNVLKNAVRIKLMNSSLGREFSKVESSADEKDDDEELETIQDQINNLLSKSYKLNSNLKAISELYMEKVKLMTKIHAASITASGLPHLSVAEMSLIKKIATNKNHTEEDASRMQEMEKTALMLDTHIQWSKKSHVFHEWMATVLDEYEKAEEPTFSHEAITELAKFTYLLRHMVKKRLKFLKNDNLISLNLLRDCPSKLLRVQKSTTEAQMNSNNEVETRFDKIEENLRINRRNLELELKTVLSFIPNCVQVSL